jgi:site-specific recombinase XerD
MSQPTKKLLDLLRDQIQLKHYSPRIEESYVRWVREFILFQKAEAGTFRHPDEMGMSEVNQFLTYLPADRKVAASTQNQALSAIIFLYKYILQMSLKDDQLSALRASKPKRFPTVLSRAETLTAIELLQDTNKKILHTFTILFLTALEHCKGGI